MADAMTEPDANVRELLQRNLDALMQKDKAGVLSCFAPDAVFIDPHYPYSEMRGTAEIAAGMEWVFTGMDRLGFTVIGSFTSDDGLSAALELDCSHVLVGGRALAFRQVLIAETADGLLTRVQAYEPYGPGGVAGFFMGIQNRRYRARHKRVEQG